MSQTLEESDEGKTVLSADGDEVGTVDWVEHGTAYIDADEGLLEDLKTAIGSEEEGTHTVVRTDVAEVTDEEVRLKES